MKINILILVALLAIPQLSFAQNVSLQEQCFIDLKANLNEATIFDAPLSILNDADYTYVQTQFSEKVSTLQSFFINVDKPIISLRLASFGEQTGYIHPPKSVFPNYLKSTPWPGPVKEYVVGEEYVTDPQGQEHFLNCFFLQIESADLMAVTAERYAYDGVGISILKTAADQSYKATFEESPSFDQNHRPLATWTRVFVYPKAANNPYFNKHEVIEAFPANKVSNFSLLSVFNQDLMKIEDYDVASNLSITKYFKQNEEGTEPEEIEVDPALQPYQYEGVDEFYPTAKYNQAIINTFPEFAENLSILGSLKYTTFIDIMTSSNLDPETEKFMTVFSDGDTLTKFYFKEELDSTNFITDTELERIIPLVQNGDWTIAQIRAGAKFDDLVFQPESMEVTTTSVPLSDNNSTSKTVNIIVIVLGIILIVLLVSFLRKKTNSLPENLA